MSNQLKPGDRVIITGTVLSVGPGDRPNIVALDSASGTDAPTISLPSSCLRPATDSHLLALPRLS